MLSVPLLVLAAERGSGQLFWVTPLNWHLAQQAAVTLLSAGMPPNFHHTATTVATEIVMWVAVIAALALAARAVFTQPAPESLTVPAPERIGGRWSRHGRCCSFWPGCWSRPCSPLVAYAAGEPVELARITILMMPALALLLAWVLFRPVVPPALGIFLCAALLVLRLAQVVPSYGVSPENWKAATDLRARQYAGG